MSADLFYTLLAGGVINGLITFGVVKTTLFFHQKQINEVRGVAEKAHDRIDAIFTQRLRRHST